MARSDLHWYHRSSPLLGAIGGLLTAASTQFIGPRYPDAMLADEIQALFDASPILGYVTFVVAGAVLGGMWRWIERALA